MPPPGTISLLIILVTVVFSYKGFRDRRFFEAYEFRVDKVLFRKDYWRLVTSGFLHLNWLHLAFNMFALLTFGSIEPLLGPFIFLLIYFTSLIGGGLLALFIHRNHASYSAAGASGAVNGVIFSAIAIAPDMRVSLIILSLPAWVFGLIYVGFSIYAIRSRRDNVGHESHLGGALIGMLLTIALQPQVLAVNLFPILMILVPGLAFIFLIVYKPHLLLVSNLFFQRNARKNYTMDQRYNMDKREEQINIDRILEKIHKKGINSLTKKERQQLDEYSKISP
jgi:membrane associated rhomboid family serine protease